VFHGRAGSDEQGVDFLQQGKHLQVLQDRNAVQVDATQARIRGITIRQDSIEVSCRIEAATGWVRQTHQWRSRFVTELHEQRHNNRLGNHRIARLWPDWRNAGLATR